MIALRLAALVAALGDPQTLLPDQPIRASLKGGDVVVFTFDVPQDTASRVIVRQEGIDLAATLRPGGSDKPEHGLDLVAGVGGEETIHPPINASKSTWTVRLQAALPKAPAGQFTISLELSAADERARAVAAARQLHQQASDLAWVGGGEATQKARDGYAAAAAAALDAGDRALAAEATYQAARSRDILGDTPGAIEGQLKALALFRELGRVDREARVLNRLGDLSRKGAEIVDAERYFDEAIQKARDAQDAYAIADTLNNSGLFKLFVGRFEEAIDQFTAALPLAREIESASVETALLANTAEAYSALGDPDQAISHFKRALSVVARMNSPRRTGRTLYQLAGAYHSSGEPRLADETIRQALSELEKAADRSYTGEAQALFARILLAAGDFEGAIEAADRAVSALREANHRRGVAGALATRAEIEIERGETDAALNRLDEALELARAVASPSVIADVQYLRARALERARRFDEAEAAIAAAVAIVESTRGGLIRSELRSSYLATVRRFFDLQIDLLARRGDVAAAFEVSERAHARSLLEGLAESASKIRRGVDPALLATQRRLQAQVNAKELFRAQAVLREGASSARVRAADAAIADLLAQWKDVEGRIRAASPGFWSLKAPEPVSVARVRAALIDERTSLVEYHLGSRRGYVWVVDQQETTLHEIKDPAAVVGLARRYHGLLSRDRSALGPKARTALTRDIEEAGQKLSALVFHPIEKRVRGKRLLIVADGALHYVPFAALPTTSGAPVLVSHELVSLPSASVLDSLRRDPQSRRASSGVAVFADPVFSKEDPRVAGRSRAEPAAASGQASATPSVPRGFEGRFERLRFSRREAEAIAAALGEKAEPALDFRAAKKALLERDWSRHRILHFATHGVLNTDHPELSGLVFSLVDPGGAPVDGFLRLHEIYNLDLNADLVVLSACRTALGKEVRGEGLIGLTRGFMYAGASRVVSTVWNVDDRASAVLMARFYEMMKSKGATPARALREAQLSLLREARWASPHYWAAFGLQGEWK